MKRKKTFENNSKVFFIVLSLCFPSLFAIYKCNTMHTNMEKVVILGRVSTDQQSYERQVIELTDYCNKVGWKVVEVFTNKVSGAETIENRKEILEMIDFIKKNDIRRVVCLEISRLGRNTLEALKVIQILNENKVSLYIKNYNLETLNPKRHCKPYNISHLHYSFGDCIDGTTDHKRENDEWSHSIHREVQT